jgi:hypothetical protein
MSDTIFTPTEARRDLDQMEKLLKRLGTEWEMYFSQAIRWPPNQRIAEIEAIVRHYTKEPPRRTADRFRFNSLVHRYRTKSELWARRRRSMEESGMLARRRAAQKGDSPTGDRGQSSDEALAAARAAGGRATSVQMREIYSALRQARRSRGEPLSDLPYSRFAEKMSRHLERARGRAQGRDLELRVADHGGKVKVVVRPVRGGDQRGER